MDNDYSINFILKTISERIKFLIKKINFCTNNKSGNSQIKKQKWNSSLFYMYKAFQKDSKTSSMMV